MARWLIPMVLTVSVIATAIADSPDEESLRQQVEAAERAFAQSMADRDFDAFVTFLADEAVFFNGDAPLRGKSAVAEGWKVYFEDPAAPFSWEPETVVVLESGTLAHSSGPVRDAAGTHVADYNSVWRREPGGEWKVVFDKGTPVCPPAAAEAD